MGNALQAAVSGLKAHQQMIDVAGNNLANVNTIGFKASRVTFSELLSETIREATSPTANIGGTNPMQIGSGASLGSLDKTMSQGTLINTGQPLDMAIEGDGYFVLSDGQKNVFTRVGSFGVDSQYNLVDPMTGYRVQREGQVGVLEGFQSPTNPGIRIPYDTALPSKATTLISYNGNLSADDSVPTTHEITTGIQFTENSTSAEGATLIQDLDQFTGADLNAGGGVTGQFKINGRHRDGTAITEVVLTVDETTTIQDLLDTLELGANFGNDSTAELVNGKIVLKEKTSGYSQTDLEIEWVVNTAPGRSLELPGHSQITVAGGNAIQTTNIKVYDSLGSEHTLGATFVRTDTPRIWDLVITSVTGDVKLIDRRLKGIEFSADGALTGVVDLGGGADASSIQLEFIKDGSGGRTINVELGSEGTHDGLYSFGEDSNANASDQDGYTWGKLLSLSISREGKLSGLFTNGVRQDVAQLKMGTFQNPAGLNASGNGYYVPSANSGDANFTTAASGGAGPIQGGMLEGSNVDVAEQFVKLIQAQSGFQANARTIRISTEMLQELTSLIR